MDIDLSKLPAMTLGEFAEFLRNRGNPDGIPDDSGGVQETPVE